MFEDFIFLIVEIWISGMFLDYSSFKLQGLTLDILEIKYLMHLYFDNYIEL